MHSHTKQTHKHLAKWCVCVCVSINLILLCEFATNTKTNTFTPIGEKQSQLKMQNLFSDVGICWFSLTYVIFLGVLECWSDKTNNLNMSLSGSGKMWRAFLLLSDILRIKQFTDNKWTEPLSSQKMCFWSSLIHLDVWPSMCRMCSLQFYMYILYKMLQWHHN